MGDTENRLEAVKNLENKNENGVENVENIEAATKPVPCKDDVTRKFEDNDDSYSFPGIGKGLLDSIRDLNEQLSSESKDSDDRENSLKVDGSDYKRKFVEESRSSIIKNVTRTEGEEKSTACSESSIFEKSDKECDSNKIDNDSVRKIESFKGVSISSVTLE